MPRLSIRHHGTELPGLRRMLSPENGLWSRGLVHGVMLLLLGLVALAPSLCAAGLLPSINDFYLLPAHCKAKLADLPENRSRREAHRLPINQGQIIFWSKKIGPDWNHLHNYCAGLTALSQANDPDWLRRNGTTRRAQFQRAAALINQSRSRSDPRNPFWFELSIKYAEAVGWSGNYQQAMSELDELIEMNPRRAEPVVLQARLTKQTGEINTAITQLKQGLQRGAKPGPLLFYLAEYNYELGDFAAAREYMTRAESEGMSMKRLRSRLPDS